MVIAGMVFKAKRMKDVMEHLHELQDMFPHIKSEKGSVMEIYALAEDVPSFRKFLLNRPTER